jgi:hypothetical protein
MAKILLELIFAVHFPSDNNSKVIPEFTEKSNDEQANHKISKTLYNIFYLNNEAFCKLQRIRFSSNQKPSKETNSFPKLHLAMLEQE